MKKYKAQSSWKDNSVQFPRLIAELDMAGVFSSPKVIRDLTASMDLSEDEILEIVDRATAKFNEIKRKLG